MNQYQEPSSAAEQLHHFYYSLAHVVLLELLQLSNKPTGSLALPPATAGSLASEEEDIDWNSLFTKEDGQKYFTSSKVEYIPPGGISNELESTETPFADNNLQCNDPWEESDLNDHTTSENSEWIFSEDEEEIDPKLALLIADLDEELNNVPQIGYENQFLNLLPFEDWSDNEILEVSWNKAWLSSDLKDLPPRGNYLLERVTRESIEILLFSFPDPIRMPGAWMTAALHQQDDSYRYFTLEKTANLDKDEAEMAMLGEWSAGGVHHNYGLFKGDLRNKEEFLNAVLAQYFADLK
ncbi:hypothetical protein [Rufibacter aurantiacus]|uniref:hypothetical protein n=1 Tax=Rufibacter aurantiacus TaxID=2817374 RepID=UPI001B306FB0|nr:hypothetical protein [Rufibacter aurantiacus]